MKCQNIFKKEAAFSDKFQTKVTATKANNGDVFWSNTASNVGSKQWKFIGKLEKIQADCEIATGIIGKEDATRVATLLTVIENEALDVYDTFVWTTVGEDKKIAKVLKN